LSVPGLIEIDFADFCATVRGRHAESFFAAAEAVGATRSREVVDKLLSHPMLDGGKMLAESETVLVSLMSGPDLTMVEVNRVMEEINRRCEHAQVIMGAALDENFRERLAVTLIAARKDPDRAQRVSRERSMKSWKPVVEPLPTRVRVHGLYRHPGVATRKNGTTAQPAKWRPDRGAEAAN
jgi:cell division GTPase FtsZ